MDISYLLTVLWRKKWILILIPLVAALCAFLVKSQLPQNFKSSTQLSTGFTLGDQISFSDERFSSNDVGLKFSNLIEIINSKMVVSLVSYQLMLNDLKEPESFRARELEGELLKFVNEERDEIIKVLEYKLENFELLTSFDPFEKKLINLLGTYGYNYENLVENMDVSRVGLSDFVVIEFLSEDPELSAYVVNTMSDELFRYNNMLKSNRSGESVEFFEELVAQKRDNLNEKAEALKTFKASRNVLNVEMEGESTIEQIRQLEEARQEERQKIYRLQLSIQNINNRLKGVSNGGTSNNQRILELKDDVNRINSKISSGTGGPNLQDSLDYYRQELQNEMAGSYSESGGAGMTKEELIQERNTLQIELTVANSSLRSINSTIETLKGNVSGYANTESTINSLQREVDEATDEYNLALERFNSAKNSSLISNSSLKQVIAGQPAGEPESSKTLIIIIGAWFASLVLCAFVIIGIELTDVSIKLPAQFERATGVPLIGYLNRIPKQTDLNDLLTSANQNVDLRKFNHLLKKLRFEIEDTKSKVLMVTSTKEYEGKTFFIVSLSYSLSLINKKVLLIDTNFKNNSLTQLFLSKSKSLKALEEHNYVRSNNGKEPVGLLSEGDNNTYTEDKEEIPYNYDGIISKTGIKGIDIVGSRGGEYSPAEIFSSKNFHSLLNTFSKEYDYIILEGTSLNEYSDTKELAEYVDKVIAVFSAYSKIGSNDNESIEFLKSLGSKFFGGVLNNVAIEDIKA